MVSPLSATAMTLHITDSILTKLKLLKRYKTNGSILKVCDQLELNPHVGVGVTQCFQPHSFKTR